MIWPIRSIRRGLETACCFQIAQQAQPINVRLRGNLAYVCTIGAGLQTVSLTELARVNAIPFEQRNTFERNGGSALIGGYRLPNPETKPPTPGDAFDIGVGVDGLALVGGSDPSLHILADTSGGFVAPISQQNGDNWFTLQSPIQRILTLADVLVRKDVNGDGKLDFQNLNLAAISHGGAGFSLVDFSRPNDPQVLCTGSGAGTLFDLAYANGFLFSGERVITITDPSAPIVSAPLSFKDQTGTQEVFSGGGDVALSTALNLVDGSKLVHVLSSDATRGNLQIGMLRLKTEGLDWDIIRNLPQEPRIHPDNRDYLFTGDPINPFSGEMTVEAVDLEMQGRSMDFTFRRTYRSQIAFDGPLGQGWDFEYNDRLTVLPASGNPILFTQIGEANPPVAGDVLHYDGSGRIDKFQKSGSGYSAPRGVFEDLQAGSDSEGPFYTLKDPAGTEREFRPTRAFPLTRYQLVRTTDRFGNKLRFKLQRARSTRDDPRYAGARFYAQLR